MKRRTFLTIIPFDKILIYDYTNYYVDDDGYHIRDTTTSFYLNEEFLNA